MNLVQVEKGVSDNGYAPSPSLWKDFRVQDLLRKAPGNDGLFVRYDFANFRTSTNINASEAYWCNGLKAYGSDGGAIAALAAQGGGITLSSDGDNEGVAIGSMVFPFQISRSHKKLAFEARIKTSTITDTKHGFFLGLGDSMTLSATVPIAAAGTLATTTNIVGFHRLEGDGDYVDAVYQANTVTPVTVEADSQVLVADTWIKLGMRYEPSGPEGRYYLRFFANGLRIASVQVASAAGTDFPNDVQLGFVFALLNATASTPGNTSIQWAQIAQEF
jgi:hypothetical protein